MTLLQQFQALIGSIFFGFIFTHLWYVFNRIFYKWEGTFKRFILEVPLFISFSYLYFLFLVNICNGKLSIYYLLCIALGLFIYVKFYAPKFNKFHEKILNFLNDKVFKKIKDKISTSFKKSKLYDFFKKDHNKKNNEK
ncbi:MAG: spore cortex biosynthesis protein YabQ [Bacilli bacterium]